MPNGDDGLRDPGNMERERTSNNRCENAELGATREIVTELPGKVPR